MVLVLVLVSTGSLCSQGPTRGRANGKSEISRKVPVDSTLVSRGWRAYQEPNKVDPAGTTKKSRRARLAPTTV